MFKNTAGQKWRVFAFHKVTNNPVEGHAASITATIEKDYGAPAALADTNPDEAPGGGGYYYFDLTQSETDGDFLALTGASSDSLVQIVPDPPSVFTNPTAVRNGNNPLAVSITRDSDLAGVGNVKVQVEGTELVGFTDSQGNVDFLLTDGNYNLLIYPSALYETPAATPVVIPAESSKAVELVTAVVPAPDLPDQCLCMLSIVDHTGEPLLESVEVTSTAKTDAEFPDGSLIQNKVVSVTTTTGSTTFPLIRGVTYTLVVRYERHRITFDYTVPDDATASITQAI